MKFIQFLDMQPLPYRLFLILMIITNLFALYFLATDGAIFMSEHAAIKSSQYEWFRWLPLVNLMALGGMWVWKKWGVALAFLMAMFTIICDIAFEIDYHMPISIVSAVLLVFFLAKYQEKWH